ncbi:MAG: Elongation factor P [Deltaproteobacteria bacterium ADurb.BinA179]|mgnify:FL=1|jgi:elongation factor P|nr:elongation factor P [Deltaproteobacteria bacterium]MDI9543142.1 elongation factor P [Pseudomonadota bacterium]NLW66587.1 elongation factor P [Bacteriovoracaceae bacterium]OPZ27667.1 MAG: Elongation factor P [Deltaproteobacteria bacterium ADurb.BinA179]HRR22250.1 elongation factor P [Desulfomonilia bacterium]
MQYSTAQFRKGLKIELDGEPFTIVDFQHVKPGKGGAFVRTRMKSLITGNVLEKTFRSGEKVDVPNLEERKMSFLYQDDSGYWFMDTQTFEQMNLSEDHIEDAIGFLKENVEVGILFHNGAPIGIDLPMFLELAVAETDPGIRGNTASGGSKPAKLETGVTVQVPLFISEGDVIKVDTRTKAYIERVS